MAYARTGRLGAVPVGSGGDLATLISALQLPWSPDLFGFTSWDDALAFVRSTGGVYGTSGFGTMFISPSGAGTMALAALVAAWDRFNALTTATYPTLSMLTSVLPGNTLGVSATDWQNYLAAYAQYAGWIVKAAYASNPAMIPQSVSNPAPPAQPVTAQSILDDAVAAWDAAAMQSGLLIPPQTSGPGAYPQHVTGLNPENLTNGGTVIPTSAIVEGPTDLPDGTWYVVFQSNPKNGTGYPALTVVNQPGPSYIPPQAQDVSIRPDSAVPLVPGTGAWYWFCAVTGSNPSNPATGAPVGWSQGFALVGPMALQAVREAYAWGGMSAPGPVGPVITPDGSTPPQSGGPSYMVAAPPNGGVVIQDQDGNIIPPQVAPPSVSIDVSPPPSVSLVPVTQAPPVEVGTLPSATVSVAPQPAGFSTTDALIIAGAIAAVGVLLSMRGR